MLGIVSYICESFVFPLRSSVFYILLPIFYGLFYFCWVLWVLYLSLMSVLYQLHGVQKCFPMRPGVSLFWLMSLLLDESTEFSVWCNSSCVWILKFLFASFRNSVMKDVCVLQFLNWLFLPKSSLVLQQFILKTKWFFNENHAERSS